MHILIVPSWYPTIENPIDGIFFKEQAEALRRRGHKVTVAFPEVWSVHSRGNHHGGRGIFVAEENGVRVYNYRGYNYLPNVPYGSGIIYLNRLKKLYKRILKEQGRPDIIHAHSCFWGGWAAARLAIKSNLPLVFTEHSSKLGRGLLKSYQHRALKDVLKHADRILAVGPGLKRELGSYISEEKIKLVPNMVNVEAFELNHQNHSDGKPFRFLSVAFLNRNKGMDVLIKAFASQFKNQNAELIIGGDGAEKPNLEQLVSDLSIESQVHFLGALSREDVKKQMQLADAFVLASRYETFGVVFIEALASGKPIIATACGGPEMIVNEKNGMLVPVDDIDALGKAMADMTKCYNMYKPTVIREDCLQRFSEESVINQLESIYNSIVK